MKPKKQMFCQKKYHEVQSSSWRWNLLRWNVAQKDGVSRHIDTFDCTWWILWDLLSPLLKFALLACLNEASKGDLFTHLCCISLEPVVSTTGLNSNFNLQCYECFFPGPKLTVHTHTHTWKRLICVFTTVLKIVSQLDVTAEQSL